MNWAIKNWPAILLLLAGICACVATFFLSKQDQQQKDAIEKLGKENVKLSTNIERLNTINNQISESIKDVTSKNLELTTESKKLIKEVQNLSIQSKDLIAKVDRTTLYQAAQNLQTGELINFEPSYKEIDMIHVIIGGMVAGNTVSQIKQGAKPFMVGGKDILSAHFENDKLLISLNVYDLYGNLIAEIENNYWRPNKNFTGKFNYDKHGFEVINNQGEVAINVDFEKENSIIIQGIFPFIQDNVIILAGKTTFTLTFNDTFLFFKKWLEKVQVRQLFEYNRKHWLGVRKIYN